MSKQDEALALARDFEREGFGAPDLYERFWRLKGDEAACFTLADSLLRWRRESGALLDDATSYVSKEDFKALVSTAMEILREEGGAKNETQRDKKQANKNSARQINAQGVIAVASLEFAPLLHPYLEEIFSLRPNDGTYYECYPWRELDYESSQIWRERLASAQTSTDDKRRIFECLLQTRQPRNIKFACETAVAEKFLEHKGSLSEHLGYYLEDVGFTLERVKFTGGANGAELADENLSQTQGVLNDVKFNASKLNSQADENLNDPKFGKNVPCEESRVQKAQASDEMSIGGEAFRLKRYCGERAYHVAFRQGYFSEPFAAHQAKNHPTWGLWTDEAQKGESKEAAEANLGETKYKIGGVLDEPCADEENPLFHLITLDPVPRELPVRSLPSLILAAHVREISEGETAFYEHDRLGKPKRIGERSQIEYVDDEPARQDMARLRVAPKRWYKQDWALSNGRQNLSRIGGEPSWIQSAQVPTCPICGEKMEFLMQLDSGLPSGEDEELLFGSGGILYVFWCERSRVSAFFMQCT